MNLSDLRDDVIAEGNSGLRYQFPVRSTPGRTRGRA